MVSPRLCGGMLVAMPTAMPLEPLTSRFGKRAGRTCGSCKLVVVGLEVDGLLVEVAQQLHGGFVETSLGVTHGSRRVAVDRAEVSVTVDQRKSHGERLGEAHHRAVHGRIAMRMILADDVADRTGGLHMGFRGHVAGLVHRVEDAAMNGLQTVANVGQRTRDDDAHGVLEKRRLHLLAEVGGAHDGAFSAVGVFDDGSVRIGHVDDHRLSALFLGNEAPRFLQSYNSLRINGRNTVASQTTRLNVQESDVTRVLLDELLTRFNLIAHKLAHHALGLGGVVDVHL